MKFFNYSKIPTDQYKQVIDTAATFINLKLLKHSKDLLSLLTKEKDKSKIMETVITYAKSGGLDEESLELLEISAITLYDCINGKLQAVCEAYDINQGHLGDAEENNVYEIVKASTLKTLSGEI